MEDASCKKKQKTEVGDCSLEVGKSGIRCKAGFARK